VKRGIYIGVIVSALLVLAVCGWIVKGVKKAASPAPRPRFA
jgi:putative effector of murein hydrolase LrgA (UPF0299 family)